ncbi:Glycosyl transferase family 8 protein [Trichomonas vaginalis G3]|uniref:Glycosyl transferase family 8 protein n=1 Tax=Trichomonas vaginalis (strain ATCC PRA-98 / G3) TaxID=412133 RepID=A2DXT6_TRIV3|nr:glycosyl transferase [Trichomonas vaginalis G3]EAY14796.1 Glycosyl transferase family 8 protein [Trichomonas vaginalis G3]KAI5508071.1 spore coat polysaccharide biosynthesis protein SpsA, Chain A domain-containing protein [Trichomonas vaginalis G3]|eukprot:XP_001327019.1 glycosyl transferase [Trichomonas vaginalis G3]
MKFRFPLDLQPKNSPPTFRYDTHYFSGNALKGKWKYLSLFLVFICYFILSFIHRYPHVTCRLFPHINILYSWAGSLTNLGPAMYSAINSLSNYSLTIYVCTTHPEEVPIFQKRLDQIKIKYVTFIAEYHNVSSLTTKYHLGIISETYIRIVFSDAHPELERFLQLDGDTLVTGSFDEFYFAYFNDTYAVVVLDIWKEYEGFKNYFNCGSVVFNCQKFRDDKMADKVRTKLKEYEVTRGEWNNDQTVLNDIFGDKKIIAHKKYNEFMPSLTMQTRIFHFYGLKKKPYKPNIKSNKYYFRLWRCYFHYFNNSINPWEFDRDTKICTRLETFKYWQF